jgi:hypothetical protein
MAAMRSRHGVVARFPDAAKAVLVALAVASASSVAITLSTPAWADTHGDAVKAFEEGRKLRDTDPEKAARAFERSISLEPSIGAYYNLGQVNEQLDRHVMRSKRFARQRSSPRRRSTPATRTRATRGRRSSRRTTTSC